MINKTLAILAGGKSSRMNYNNKAMLMYKEKTFIEHIMESGKGFNETIIISNHKEIYENLPIKIFNDIYLGNGPLSGIHSALKHSRNNKVLCVACDMPLITEKILNDIANVEEDYEILVPEINGRLQPLCSIYSKSLISKIEKLLMKKENKLQNFIMGTNYKVLDDKYNQELNEKYFSNINTPEEYILLNR